MVRASLGVSHDSKWHLAGWGPVDDAVRQGAGQQGEETVCMSTHLYHEPMKDQQHSSFLRTVPPVTWLPLTRPCPLEGLPTSSHCHIRNHISNMNLWGTHWNHIQTIAHFNQLSPKAFTQPLRAQPTNSAVSPQEVCHWKACWGLSNPILLTSENSSRVLCGTLPSYVNIELFCSKLLSVSSMLFPLSASVSLIDGLPGTPTSGQADHFHNS